MIRPQEESDTDLLRRVSAGDEDAFRLIYQRCHGPIYRFVLHMTGNTFIAEDVTQEVFMALIQESGRFDASRGSLPAYLFGIGRNLLLRRLEKEQAFVPFFEQEPANVPTNHKTGDHRMLVVPPVDLVRSETIERVRRAVSSLPANYREVVVLCDLQEMSYDEVSRVLDCAVGTVRSRLHRGRVLLTEKLRELHEPALRQVAGGE